MSGNTSHLDGYIGKSYQVASKEVTVQKVIAEGGFGIVFLVRDAGGKRYALKRILVNNRDDLRCCEREIFIMRSLRTHPHIVRLVESYIQPRGGDVHEALMLMEFCQGGSCLQHMNEVLSAGGTHFPEQRVMEIFDAVVEGLAGMHHMEKPCIHRDLKVENILLGDDGKYKLCDFGSATRTFVQPQLGNVQVIEENLQRFTTLSYRAPEMVDLYSNRIINTKADIWALGVLLYKLCFFSLPFGESMVAIMEGNFKLPERSPYSKDLHSLICFLLTVDPETRPDIFQVAYVVSNMRRKPLQVKNICASSIPGALPEPPPLGEKRHQSKKSALSANVGLVTQTTLTPRQRPRGGHGAPAAAAATAPAPTASGAVSTRACPTSSPTSPSEVDAFGASRFTAPAAPAVTPGPAQGAAVVINKRPRRAPASSVPAAAVDPFGAPQFAPTAAPSVVPADVRKGGPERIQSALSVTSNDSFDPRRVESPEVFDPRSGGTTSGATDPFGAPVFNAPSGQSNTKSDPFGSAPFGEQQLLSSSETSPTNSSRPSSCSMPRDVVSNPAADPFDMQSFAGSVTAGASTMSLTTSSATTQLLVLDESTPAGSPGTGVKSPLSPVDAFGAPVFINKKVVSHRRVSSDVTAAFSSMPKDPFDATPFCPPSTATPAPSAGSSTRNPSSLSIARPSQLQQARSVPPSPIDMGMLQQPRQPLPHKMQQRPTAPAMSMAAPAAQPLPKHQPQGQQTAAASSWSAKQRELLMQKERLEEKRRALLSQQQQLAMEQQRIADMQTQLGAQFAGSPTPTLPAFNGQVFANPMAQQARPLINFAHASSLSPSGARLAGAMLQQQQHQQFYQQNQMMAQGSPAMARSPHGNPPGMGLQTAGTPFTGSLF